MSEDHFSVFQFLSDGSSEKVRAFVGPKEAVEAARHYTDNVAAKIGLTVRVIITDADDMTCFEWIAGQGVTFPPEARGRR